MGYGALGAIGTDQATWDAQHNGTQKGPVIAFYRLRDRLLGRVPKPVAAAGAPPEAAKPMKMTASH